MLHCRRCRPPPCARQSRLQNGNSGLTTTSNHQMRIGILLHHEDRPATPNTYPTKFTCCYFTPLRFLRNEMIARHSACACCTSPAVCPFCGRPVAELNSAYFVITSALRHPRGGSFAACHMDHCQSRRQLVAANSLCKTACPPAACKPSDPSIARCARRRGHLTLAAQLGPGAAAARGR